MFDDYDDASEYYEVYEDDRDTFEGNAVLLDREGWEGPEDAYLDQQVEDSLSGGGGDYEPDSD